MANYAFDVTPAHLVTGLVTERGVCEASPQGLRRHFPGRRSHEREKRMRNLWSDRDARAAVQNISCAGRQRRPRSAHIYDASARRRPAPRPAWRWQYVGQDRHARSRGGVGKSPVRERLGLGYGDNRAAGFACGAACSAAKTRRPQGPQCDEEMVAIQRGNLLDSAQPNPSVETLCTRSSTQIRRSYACQCGSRAV